MREHFFKFGFWLWNNISNIDAIKNILIFIISVITPAIIRLWNEHRYLKKYELDSYTKQSVKYYVPTRGSNIDPCDQEDIEKVSGFELMPFFIKAFKNSESKYFIILADSGMGKTTFLLKLFFKYRRKIFKRYQIILLSLSKHKTLDKIRKIKKKQKTILLLDSFDEDSFAMEDYISRLKVLCNETELFYKVIMTCRTQFFPDSKNEPRITGKIKFGVGKKNIEFEKYYILPFSDLEIYTYLKKKYNPFFKKEKFERSLNLIKRCPQLVVRPMLLSYIDDLIVDSEKEYNYVYEIYSQLVSKWIEREALSDNNLIYKFSEKVAEYMYFNKTIYIEALEIENLCKEYNIELRSIEAKSRSLLNRNANGAYKFAHKSILEYFLSEKAYKELEFRKIVLTNGFNGYDMLELFIKEKSLGCLCKILQDNPKKIESVTFKYFILPKIDLSGIDIIDCDFEKCIFSEANFAVSTLNNVNLSKCYLEKANFLGAKLINTNLNDATLIKCEFRNACFENTNLEGANLERANLEGAKLKGINLRETNLSQSSLSWANLKGADLTGSDLNQAILISTDFRKASLRGVDLNKSYLLYSKSKCLFEYNYWLLDVEDNFEGSFEGADLTGVDLSGANLTNMNFQSAKLVSANLSNSILLNSNLNNAELEGAELEASIWDSNNIFKVLPQLKIAKFRYIIVENQNIYYRSNLFPDGDILNYSKKSLDFKELEKVKAAGIDLLKFRAMNNLKKIEALKDAGLDPLDFDIY